MRLKKILTILELLIYIFNKGQCTVSNITSRFEINEKTLYRYLKIWAREGYFKKVELLDDERNSARIAYEPTVKLKHILIEIYKILIQNNTQN